MDEQAVIKKKVRINRTTVVVTAQKIMLLYLVVWSISPPLSIDMIFRIAALICAVGWFFLDLSTGLRLDKMQKLALIYMVFVALVALIEYKGDLSMLIKPIAIYMLVFAYIINYSYTKRVNELWFLIPVFIALLIVFNLITIKALLVDSSLARRLVRADETIYPYLRQGIGGYAMVYSEVLLSPLIFAWTFNARKNNILCFILGVAWALTYLFLLLKSGYSIAIASTFISVLILIFYKKRSIIPAVVIAFGIIVIFVLMIGYIDGFRNALLDAFEGTTVAKKINDIYYSLQGVETADSITARIIRYSASINTIFSYPIIGGLWWDGGGGHSALLDAFAKYGLWGGLMFVNMFYCVPSKIKEKSDNNKDIRISNALLVSLIIITLLDTVPYQMVFPVLVVAPIFFNDIQKWRDKNESSVDSKSDTDQLMQET